MKRSILFALALFCSIFAGDKEDEQLIALIKNDANKSETKIVAEAKELIKKGANVNAKTKTEENKDWTPLHYAVNKGYVEVVKFLVEGTSPTADPNAVDKSKKTPLLFAVQYANPKDKNYDQRKEIVEYLLTKGANPNLSNSYKEHPLYIATRICANDIINILLNNKPNAADIRMIPGNKFLEHILHWRCIPLLDIMLKYVGDKDFTQALKELENIDYSTIVRLMGNDMKTDEFEKYLQLLLDHGADINKKDKTMKEAPLANALMRNNLEYALSLLKTDKDIDVNDQDNSSAMDKSPLALLFEINTLFKKENDAILAEIIQLMMDKGAKLDLKDRFNKSVLENAHQALKNVYADFPKVSKIVSEWSIHNTGKHILNDLGSALSSIASL